MLWLSIVFLILIVGTIVVCQMSLPYIAIGFVYLMQKTLCSRSIRRLLPIVKKNLAAHQSKNTKSGVMMLTSVMFLIVVNSFSDQLLSIMISTFKHALVGDMILMVPQLTAPPVMTTA